MNIILEGQRHRKIVDDVYMLLINRFTSFFFFFFFFFFPLYFFIFSDNGFSSVTASHPVVIQQAYVFPPSVSTLAVTLTEHVCLVSGVLDHLALRGVGETKVEGTC